MKLTSVFEIVSDKQIIDLEKAIGLLLPDDYKSFLLKNNGGRPVPNNFRTSNGEYESDIQFFFGLTQGNYGIEDNYILLRERLLDEEIAIAVDSGGNYILLDLSTSKVYFFDHEIEERFLIADNFKGFIDSLFPRHEKLNAFDQAIEVQNVRYFESALKSKKNIGRLVNQFNQPAFIVACLRGKLKVVRFLVENGMSLEGGVLAASSNGHVNVVGYLLDRGADPNERDPAQNNDTALIQASMGGFLDVVKLLVSKGAQIEAEDIHGQTALNKACWSGNKDVVAYLEKWGKACS